MEMRIIQGGNALWKDILVAKYKERILYEVNLGEVNFHSHIST
jgi:hypothetical protein